MKIRMHAASGTAARGALLGLCGLVPFMMGGCPEFRDDVVAIFETATRSALLGSDDRLTITNAVRTSLVDATIDLFYDQFLSNGS